MVPAMHQNPGRREQESLRLSRMVLRYNSLRHAVHCGTTRLYVLIHLFLLNVLYNLYLVDIYNHFFYLRIIFRYFFIF